MVLVLKNPPVNAGDAGSIPGSERSPGIGSGNPLQYSCLGNSMGRGAWWTTVYGFPNSRTEQQSLSELLYNIALVSCSLFLFDSAILAGGKWNPRVSGIPFNDKGTRWGWGALP